MNKEEFLIKLKDGMKNLDKSEQDEIISYYNEIISDSIEAGKVEDDVISSLGNVDDILKKIDLEVKVKKVNEKPTAKNKMNAIVAILGIMASPILVPLALVFVILIFTLFIVGIAIDISLFSAILSLIFVICCSFTLFLYTPYALAIILLLIGTLVFLIGLSIIFSKFVFHTVMLGVINICKNKLFKKKEGIKNV